MKMKKIGASKNFTVYRSATVSFNVFIEFAEFSDKIFVITVKGFQPATSCVRDDDVPKTPIRHIYVRDMIFKLTPAHASVICQIP